MGKKILHFSVLTLIIGIFIGCASSNPYVDDAKSNIRDGNYKAALEAAEQAITNHPQDPLGYYYKGVALGDLAQDEENPDARNETYKEMNAAFEQARELAGKMEDPPGEMENLGAVKTTIWSKEHNRAIELATNDSVKKTVDQPLKKSINHLQNATVIMPDSTLSWDVLSEVYFMDKNLDGAIEAKQKVIDLKEKPAVEDYTRLADFYIVNKRFEEAAQLLEKARQAYPDTVAVIEKLADAYMNSGEYDKAIASVEELIQTDPQNPQYHLALGTQYYQAVLRLNDSLSTNYDQIFELQQKLQNASGSEQQNLKQQIASLEENNNKLQDRIDSLTQNAIEELNTVVEYRPNDASAYNTLGVIYQNKASALFEKRNQTADNQKASELDKQAKENLRQSMEHYEKAVEIDPDNQDYWKSLYRVYVALGMDEKAKEAEEKAGM